ncbi:RICIN domain-containing protein [Nonomuraea sp. NPDC005983]|uniref:RICIN domain-containing protein n=1 Tax=Nonomuraea sp. NPDC005983 TaxID=3155595 RepID=UPI0033BCEE85
MESTTHAYPLSRRAVLGGAAGVALGALLPGATARADPPSPPAGSSWQLVDSLSDDFAGSAFDPARWRTGLWYATSGVGAFNPANVSVADSNLLLTAEQESYNGKSYTFGAVQSLFEVPGVNTYVEVRAKVLNSQANVLSAIWMQTAPGTAKNDPNPEIDIEETFNFTGLRTGLHVWPTSSTIGWGPYLWDSGIPDISADYHLYGLERRDGRLRVYFDGQLGIDLAPPDLSLLNMSRRMIFSLEGHLGQPNDAYLPASFAIDYVRTYYAVPNMPDPSGQHRLANRKSGLVLTAPASGSATDPVTQETWTGSALQLWTIARTDDWTYTLTNAARGGYLDLKGGYAQNGVAIVQNPTATTTGSQRWHVFPTDSGFLKLQSRLSGKAVAVAGASLDPGVQIVEMDFGDAQNDQWMVQ